MTNNEDTSGDVINLYTEKSSHIIHEAKFFTDFVIVRPAAPALYGMIKKLPHSEFLEGFEECAVKREVVLDYINGEYEGDNYVE